MGNLAAEAGDFLRRMYPICRSITGDGVRETLRIVQDYAGFEIKEYPSGERIYDWTVPDEWNIRDAYIADEKGKRLIDFRNNGLHVVSYSVPVNARMPFAELEPHLHSLPRLPDAIPYRTSYFKRDWGFCLSHRQLESFDRDGAYAVVIDSELKPGAMSFAEARLEGTSGQEFLISSYCCHPWMANDNLSGLVVTALIYRALAQRELRHSYRFVMVPETIGAIAYLAHNEEAMKKIAGGFVVSCCGGPGPLGYKESFLGNHMIDRAVRLAFQGAGVEPVHYPFAPDGSDERQYSMPAFRIPVGTICKDKYYEYEQYHTSLDDLDFVTGEAMVISLNLYLAAIDILEQNRTFKSLMPYCEPQLGRRGLYPQTGGAMKQPSHDGEAKSSVEAEVDALTWVMFLADGDHDLIDMAERSGEPFSNLADAARKLEANELLEELRPADTVAGRASSPPCA